MGGSDTLNLYCTIDFFADYHLAGPETAGRRQRCPEKPLQPDPNAGLLPRPSWLLQGRFDTDTRSAPGSRSQRGRSTSAWLSVSEWAGGLVRRRLTPSGAGASSDSDPAGRRPNLAIGRTLTDAVSRPGVEPPRRTPQPATGLRTRVTPAPDCPGLARVCKKWQACRVRACHLL